LFESLWNIHGLCCSIVPLLFMIHASNTCMPCQLVPTILLVLLSPHYLLIGIVDRCYNTALLDSIHRRHNRPSCIGPSSFVSKTEVFAGQLQTIPTRSHQIFTFASFMRLGFLHLPKKQYAVCLYTPAVRPLWLVFSTQPSKSLIHSSDQLLAANPFRSLQLP